jgi:hypothetical protein
MVSVSRLSSSPVTSSLSCCSAAAAAATSGTDLVLKGFGHSAVTGRSGYSGASLVSSPPIGIAAGRHTPPLSPHFDRSRSSSGAESTPPQTLTPEPLLPLAASGPSTSGASLPTRSPPQHEGRSRPRWFGGAESGGRWGGSQVPATATAGVGGYAEWSSDDDAPNISASCPAAASFSGGGNGCSHSLLSTRANRCSNTVASAGLRSILPHASPCTRPGAAVSSASFSSEDSPTVCSFASNQQLPTTWVALPTSEHVRLHQVEAGFQAVAALPSCMGSSTSRPASPCSLELQAAMDDFFEVGGRCDACLDTTSAAEDHGSLGGDGSSGISDEGNGRGDGDSESNGGNSGHSSGGGGGCGGGGGGGGGVGGSDGGSGGGGGGGGSNGDSTDGKSGDQHNASCSPVSSDGDGAPEATADGLLTSELLLAMAADEGEGGERVGGRAGQDAEALLQMDVDVLVQEEYDVMPDDTPAWVTAERVAAVASVDALVLHTLHVVRWSTPPPSTNIVDTVGEHVAASSSFAASPTAAAAASACRTRLPPPSPPELARPKSMLAKCAMLDRAIALRHTTAITATALHLLATLRLPAAAQELMARPPAQYALEGYWRARRDYAALERWFEATEQANELLLLRQRAARNALDVDERCAQLEAAAAQCPDEAGCRDLHFVQESAFLLRVRRALHHALDDDFVAVHDDSSQTSEFAVNDGLLMPAAERRLCRRDSVLAEILVACFAHSEDETIQTYLNQLLTGIELASEEIGWAYVRGCVCAERWRALAEFVVREKVPACVPACVKPRRHVAIVSVVQLLDAYAWAAFNTATASAFAAAAIPHSALAGNSATAIVSLTPQRQRSRAARTETATAVSHSLQQPWPAEFTRTLLNIIKSMPEADSRFEWAALLGFSDTAVAVLRDLQDALDSEHLVLCLQRLYMWHAGSHTTRYPDSIRHRQAYVDVIESALAVVLDAPTTRKILKAVRQQAWYSMEIAQSSGEAMSSGIRHITGLALNVSGTVSSSLQPLAGSVGRRLAPLVELASSRARSSAGSAVLSLVNALKRDE